jgi:hypothetical protein
MGEIAAAIKGVIPIKRRPVLVKPINIHAQCAHRKAAMH